jgi:single stranded DNA-binding protein
MAEASVSFAGNLTDDPEVRYTEGGIARAMFRVAVSGRREQEASFFTVIVWRDQAEHAAQSHAKGSRVVVVGRLQQRAWTAEDGTACIVAVTCEYRSKVMPIWLWPSRSLTTFRCTPLAQQQRGPARPQVMEADAGQASAIKQRKEAPLPQIVRVQRPTHGVGKDQALLLPAGPLLLTLCGLPLAMLHQRRHGQLRQHHRPA